MFNLKPSIKRLLLSLLSGLLLWACWPPSQFFIFIFIALVPLLVIEKQLSEENSKNKGWKFFGYSFLSLVIWNVLTTYWIYFATASVGVGPAASAAWILNALFQSLPFVGYYRIKKRYNQRMGLLALISFWLLFEWTHFSWELAWPWLTLGNSFAKVPQIVQWYEYLGVSGGTLWILVINCLVFLIISNKAKRSFFLRWSLALLILPVIFSLIRYSTYQEQGEEIEVVLVQPNVDPYQEQLSSLDAITILNKMYDLAKSVSTSNTDYIVFPETSLPDYVWKSNISQNVALDHIKKLLVDVPNAQVIIGVDLFENYGSIKQTPTARYSTNGDFYYDVYNAALEIDQKGNIEYYAKSKLVPGVERMPYPKQLRFLEKLIIDLGGASGSRATQNERTVFTAGKAKVAPAICYESIFGDYMNEFVKNGANVLFVITNDGWWKDTPGYKQHLHYARLRAIENRRDVARSANTGISGTINQRGDILSKTKWWTDAVLNEKVHLNNKRTLYTRFGDVIYRIGGLMSIIFVLISIVKRYTQDFKYRS